MVWSKKLFQSEWLITCVKEWLIHIVILPLAFTEQSLCSYHKLILPAAPKSRVAVDMPNA